MIFIPEPSPQHHDVHPRLARMPPRSLAAIPRPAQRGAAPICWHGLPSPFMHLNLLATEHAILQSANQPPGLRPASLPLGLGVCVAVIRCITRARTAQPVYSVMHYSVV
jgi:hypothetical protein